MDLTFLHKGSKRGRVRPAFPRPRGSALPRRGTRATRGPRSSTAAASRAKNGHARRQNSENSKEARMAGSLPFSLHCVAKRALFHGAPTKAHE